MIKGSCNTLFRNISGLLVRVVYRETPCHLSEFLGFEPIKRQFSFRSIFASHQQTVFPKIGTACPALTQKLTRQLIVLRSSSPYRPANSTFILHRAGGRKGGKSDIHTEFASFFVMTAKPMDRMNTSSADSGDPFHDPEPVRYLGIMFSIAALGTLANMICLWVWAAESSFQSGTCLCKVIVVWDSIYLLCVPYTIDYYFDSARRAVFISDKDLLHFWYSLSNLAQLASLQTTVLVTISRWAAVYFPLKMRHKLTKSTMYSVCVGMFTWSLCLESMEMVASRYEKTNSSIITVRTAKVIAGLVLPPVVMTTLTVSLVREHRSHQRRLSHVWRHSISERRGSSQTHDGRTSVSQGRPSGSHMSLSRGLSLLHIARSPSAKQAVEPMKRRKRSGKRSRLAQRQLVRYLFVLSFNAFIAFTVCRGSQLVVFFLVGDRELLRHMAIATIFVQMIYASFNLPVYLAFAPRFRHLLNKRVKKVTAGDRISLPRPSFTVTPSGTRSILSEPSTRSRIERSQGDDSNRGGSQNPSIPTSRSTSVDKTDEMRNSSAENKRNRRQSVVRFLDLPSPMNEQPNS
ncbi:hypothetical protein BaRGS_00004359 [Batillaria attramentaria]|uniref:G-protein coupled receptors family 1 profile domain-containing protein n=1 Tax=Batillaria attramentaria TaxID=370345 RepID=A0ABD0LZD3_9CAEN